MSDASLRELERAAAQGDEQAHVKLLSAHARAGTLLETPLLKLDLWERLELPTRRAAAGVLTDLIRAERPTFEPLGLREFGPDDARLAPMGDFMDDVFQDDPAVVQYMRWYEVDGVLKRYAWDLPTSDESEWVERGGLEFLFPWGNEVVPSQGFGSDCLELTFPDKLEVRWPLCNRFGMQSIRGTSHWCGPLAAGDSVVHGGGGECYPWQGCGEWICCLIPFNEKASSFGEHRSASIRPVVRLPG